MGCYKVSNYSFENISVRLVKLNKTTPVSTFDFNSSWLSYDGQEESRWGRFPFTQWKL